jgi:hypothetical protein
MLGTLEAAAVDRGCPASTYQPTDVLLEDFPFVPLRPCAITSERRLAQLRAQPGWEEQARLFERVLVHPLSFDRGWRRLLAFPGWSPISAGDLRVLDLGKGAERR